MFRAGVVVLLAVAVQAQSPCTTVAPATPKPSPCTTVAPVTVTTTPKPTPCTTVAPTLPPCSTAAPTVTTTPPCTTTAPTTPKPSPCTTVAPVTVTTTPKPSPCTTVAPATPAPTPPPNPCAPVMAPAMSRLYSADQKKSTASKVQGNAGMLMPALMMFGALGFCCLAAGVGTALRMKSNKRSSRQVVAQESSLIVRDEESGVE